MMGQMADRGSESSVSRCFKKIMITCGRGKTSTVFGEGLGKGGGLG
jgi:hypothetical protein